MFALLPCRISPSRNMGVIMPVPVNITARHCNVPDRIRVDAEQRVQRLQRYEPRVHNALIEFGSDHGHMQVETRIVVNGGQSIIAHGSGETFRTALDKSLDRLTRQLKRRRERVRDHKSVKLSQAFAYAPGRITVRENTDG